MHHNSRLITHFPHYFPLDTIGQAALSKCSDLFKDRLIEKEYRAIVAGRPQPDVGTINRQIQGKEAVSHYEVLDTCTQGSSDGTQQRQISTVKVLIETGRKNQIRRHMSMLGHPIIGDPRCWTQPDWDADFPSMARTQLHGQEVLDQGGSYGLVSMCLSAVRMRFVNPITNEPLEVCIEEPDHFSSLREQWCRESRPQGVIHENRNEKG